MATPTHDLLYNPSSKSKPNPISITRFSNQHQAIRRVVNKYWHILTMDLLIGPFVPNTPAFTFRWAGSLWDQLVSSDFRGGGKRDLCKNKGTFTCGGCKYCQFLNTSQNIRLPTGELFKLKHYANCQTSGIVYLILCECARFYIGKTIQLFWRRAYRHITSMRTCNPNLPLGRHFTAVHEGICPKFSFLILDRVHPFAIRTKMDFLSKCHTTTWTQWLHVFQPFLEGFT